MTLLASLLLVGAFQDVETPRTINGQAIGSPKEFETRGPGRVCLQGATIDLVEGEAATLQYAGIHHATLIVTSPKGNLLIAHGDHWADRGKGAVVIWRKDSQSIRRRGRGASVKYLYFSPTEYSNGEARLILIVSGETLKGNRRDLSRLRRLGISANPPDNCLREYSYGWDMLMGDEPLSTDKK